MFSKLVVLILVPEEGDGPEVTMTLSMTMSPATMNCRRSDAGISKKREKERVIDEGEEGDFRTAMKSRRRIAVEAAIFAVTAAMTIRRNGVEVEDVLAWSFVLRLSGDQSRRVHRKRSSRTRRNWKFLLVGFVYWVHKKYYSLIFFTWKVMRRNSGIKTYDTFLDNLIFFRTVYCILYITCNFLIFNYFSKNCLNARLLKNVMCVSAAGNAKSSHIKFLQEKSPKNFL